MRQCYLVQTVHQGRPTGVEPNACFECGYPFSWLPRVGQNHAERSVCSGQIRTYCQRPLGVVTGALMIAARDERKSKAGVGFCVATIERDCAPRQCFFLTLCSFRPAEDGGKPDGSPHKHRIEIDGPLKELLSEGVILGAGLAEMPHAALIGTPGIKACRRLAHRPLLLGVSDGRRDGDGRGLSDFILHGENVGEITVVALCPDMVASPGLN